MAVKKVDIRNRTIANDMATDEERTYISGSDQSKNRSIWIVVGTMVVLAIAAFWFYKH
ncbi:MAG: hypothetical protein ACI3ZV_01765 [Paludibacteraceae bacterium]